MTRNQTAALGHLRVLELGGGAAAYCGHFLADLGADVIKIEPPGGELGRWDPPFAGGAPDPERSLSFIFFNTNKRSIALDLTKPEGRETLKALAATADILVEAYEPGRLESLGVGHSQLRAVNPGLVFVSITPFGQTGPLAHYKATSAIVEAMNGTMYTQGDDKQPPCPSPSEQPYQLAGIHGAGQALIAIHERRSSGRGQRIDVSMQEVGTYAYTGVQEYAHNGTITRRPGPAGGFTNVHATKDGYIYFQASLENQWKALVEWMQEPALSGPEWLDWNYRIENRDVVDIFMPPFAAKFTTEEFVREAQKRHIAASPVLRPEEFAECEHVKVKGFFAEREHPVIGKHRAPGPPFQMSESPMKVRRPSPRLGEHRAEVLAELRQAKQPAVPRGAGENGRRGRALEGVRVADFSRILAGPIGTQFLSWHGAEVVRIESAELQGALRIPGRVPELNRGKRSITVDVRKPEGKELIKRVIAQSDLVVENFSAPVMGRLGLTYEELRKVKPDIIMISMPGAGKTGPLKDWAFYGQSLMCYSGITWIWGFPESTPNCRNKMHYPDYVGAALVVLMAMAGLEYRDETGKGQDIEFPQLEGVANLIAPVYMDYFANGKSWDAQGYTSSVYAPFNAYRCQGHDAWCIIACRTEEEWQALGKALGGPSWFSDERFATKEGRIRHKAELDSLIEAWTSEHTSHQAMRILQKGGVPAGVVQSAEDLYYDVQLRARGHYVTIKHPEPWGAFEHFGLTGLFSETPGNAALPSPNLGQDNDYVFKELLGLPEGEYQRLQEAKIVH